MCDRPSALVHRVTLDLVAVDLNSHSNTRSVLGVGDKDKNWVEIEWPRGRPELMVRDGDWYDSVAIGEHVVRKYPTRDSFYRYCRMLAARRGWYYVTNQTEADAIGDAHADRVIVDGPVERLHTPNAERVEVSGCRSLAAIDAPNAKYVDASGCEALTTLDAMNAECVYASDCPKLGAIHAPKAEITR